MADATVGALRVTLGTDTAQFEDGLKRAQSSLSGFAKNIGTIAAGIGLEKIIEKTMSEVVFLFKEGFERIDKIGKEAQKSGIGVEAFSGLMLSAELADVSMDTLATSLGKLSKNMVDTSRGTGEAQKTFEALGVTVTNTDGSLKGADQVLTEIAGKFANAGDSATKTAAAIALFGRSGKELIPLLNEGATGLEEMRKTAEAMGLVIDQNTSAQVQRFNDNLKILAKTKEGIVNLVIQGIIPALVRLSDQFIENAKDGAAIQQTARFVINEFAGLVSAVYETVAAFKGLSEILSLIKELWDVRNTELFNTVLANLQARVKQFPQDLEDARTAAQNLFSSLVVEGKQGLDTISAGTSKLTDAISKLQLQTAVARGEFRNFATGFAEAAVNVGLTNKNASDLSRTVAGLTPAQMQLNDAMLAFQGAKIAEDAKPPWEKFEEQIKKVQVAFDANKITAEEAARAMQKSAEQTGQTWDVVAEKSLTGWAGALQLMAKQNSQFAGAAKALAITMAVINTYQAATKALAEGGWPFGAIAAAGALAFGFAQVAAIKAQNFASGGSFRVGGGMTGMDSEMVSFMATPGELVDIRRPGATGGGGGQVQTIQLEAAKSAVFFRANIRELVTTLNAAAPDGYKLKMA